MIVHCSTYKELASDSLQLTYHRLSFFVRTSCVCADHTVFCSIGTGVKQPEREFALHVLPSAKVKDKPAAIDFTVRIVSVVRENCALKCY